ncbi:MAG TPA: VTT domain-containing protein [Methylotenera sp.]|nr:VTT domain-containing protein [Methylotenera sp.]
MMHIWQMIVDFDAHLPQLVAMHAQLVYVILFGMVYLEVGVLPLFFLPGNPFLFVCGAVWAASGLNIYLLLVVLIAAAVLGNLSGYWLGKSVGQVFFIDYLKWPKQSTLDKTRVFYDKYGQKGFLVCLFLPVVRTVAPFLAGMTNMHFTKFSRSASFGAIIWVLVCVLTGYFFGNIPLIKNHLGTAALLGLALVIIIMILKALFRKL